MKKQSGFTLIELMVVISLMALLLTWAIPAFSSWKQKHDVEGEMAQLYGDLQFARSEAYTNNEVAGISWSGTSFSQYQIMTNATADCTSIGSGGSSLVATVSTINHPITSSQNLQSLSFNNRGIVSSPSTLPLTFYITPSYGSPTNCISVSLTRISLGTWNGSNCAP